jgi:tRNA1Val (adenine37-N6)-methyltransferase
MNPDYFYFKQFKIRHANAAMKVGTDGVLLGAWVDCGNAENILDIGTGTGLLALMLAQKSNAIIDAVEIDKDAALLAAQNIKESIWHDRITVINEDIRDYKTEEKYDLIVSNPPYYSTDIIAPDLSRAKARHTISLIPHELMKSVVNLMDKEGLFYVIYPYNVQEIWENAAKDFGLYKIRELIVKPNPQKEPVRIISVFTFYPAETYSETMCIENLKRHDYSEEYRNLTEDFYIKTKK